VRNILCGQKVEESEEKEIRVRRMMVCVVWKDKRETSKGPRGAKQSKSRERLFPDKRIILKQGPGCEF